jgi:hypothetical protein
VFEQEMYHGFYYTKLMPFFHVFEAADCVIGICKSCCHVQASTTPADHAVDASGLSFVDEGEAADFFASATQYAADLGGNGATEVPTGIDNPAQPKRM